MKKLSAVLLLFVAITAPLHAEPAGNSIAETIKNVPGTAVVVIIATFGFPVVIVGLSAYFRSRKDKMLHETLRQMIEKGVPIPPELLKPSESIRKDRPRSDLRSGLVLIAVGIGLMMMLSAQHKGVGSIPLLIGVAFLIVWKIEQNKPAQPEK
ncbi:MAG: DUF6249 domain-containing protein [Verrucomicrobiota bacterium]|nr:DUF6249 domain-containing protein [Verrucomicrobiota bacterium]